MKAAPQAGTRPQPADRTAHLVILIITGLLFTAVSLAGILAADTVYPAAEDRTSFLPNDYVDLFFGMPVFVLSAAAALRSNRLGLLALGGSLLMILYNSIAYLFALHSSIVLRVLLWLTILLCSADLLIWVFRQRGAWYAKAFSPVPYPKRYGAVLILMGFVFVVRAASNLIGLVSGSLSLTLPEAGVNLADAIICTLWMISGSLLLSRHPDRYALPAAVAYVHGSLLFVALLLFMGLQPLLCSTPFVWEDMLVIGAMSLLLILPCGMLLRRLLSGSKS